MLSPINWFTLEILLYQNPHRSAKILGRKNLDIFAEKFGLPMDYTREQPDWVLAAFLAHTTIGKSINRLMKGVIKTIEDHPEQGPEYASWKVVYAILERREIYRVCEVFDLPRETNKERAADNLVEHLLKLYNDGIEE